VPDTTLPTVTLTTPVRARASRATRRQRVVQLRDETALASCVATWRTVRRFNTATLGNHTSQSLRRTRQQHRHRGAQLRRRRRTRRRSRSRAREGAVYTLNRWRPRATAAADEAGGSGLATCIARGQRRCAQHVDGGTHTFTRQRIDNAGNPSSHDPYTVLADATAPTISIVTPADVRLHGPGREDELQLRDGRLWVSRPASAGRQRRCDRHRVGRDERRSRYRDRPGANTSSKVVH